MKQTKYTFKFKGGEITVWAMNLEEAKICAQAEAIHKGWDWTIIDKATNGVGLSTFLKLIDTTMLAICELTDTDTFDEQLDCIEALKKLRAKLKEKENAK